MEANSHHDMLGIKKGVNKPLSLKSLVIAGTCCHACHIFISTNTHLTFDLWKDFDIWICNTVNYIFLINSWSFFKIPGSQLTKHLEFPEIRVSFVM